MSSRCVSVRKAMTGVPHDAASIRTAAYIDTIGEPTADLRSNIAAEARAKIVYERLINVTDDPGIQETLGFLMTREIAHQKSFEKALHSIQPNFPPMAPQNLRKCKSARTSLAHTTCAVRAAFSASERYRSWPLALSRRQTY
ncbi:manganese catalase family protein [Paraburkholderia hospita]